MTTFHVINFYTNKDNKYKRIDYNVIAHDKEELKDIRDKLKKDLGVDFIHFTYENHETATKR